MHFLQMEVTCLRMRSSCKLLSEEFAEEADVGTIPMKRSYSNFKPNDSFDKMLNYVKPFICACLSAYNNE